MKNAFFYAKSDCKLKADSNSLCKIFEENKRSSTFDVQIS